MDFKLVLAITVLLAAEICVFVTGASYMETYCEQLQCKNPRHFFTAFTDTENPAEAQAVLIELGIDVQQFQRNVLSAIDAETKAYPNARSLVSDGSAIQECRDPKTCLGLLAYWPSESVGDALSDIGVNQRRLREIVAAFDPVAAGRDILGAQKKKNVLVVIDIQNDFVDGSLSVFNDYNGADPIGVDKTKANAYTKKVGKWMEENGAKFDGIVYSIDFHPNGHCSFFEQYPGCVPTKHCDACTCKGRPGEDKIVWPTHCVQETSGAYLHADIPYFTNRPSLDDLVTNDRSYPVMEKVRMIKNHAQKKYDNNDGKTIWLFKGLQQDVDSYSAFLGNDGKTETGLDAALKEKFGSPSNINLWVLGIAYEVCVANTIKDGLAKGYMVNFLPDLSASVLDNAGLTIKPKEGGLQTKEEYLKDIAGFEKGPGATFKSHSGEPNMSGLL